MTTKVEIYRRGKPQASAKFTGGRAHMGSRDMKTLTRLKIALRGRGKRSRQTLSRRERRLIRQHAGLVARVMGTE